jgi:hypothetical protein
MNPTEAARAVSDALSTIVVRTLPTLPQIKAFLLAYGYAVTVPESPWTREVYTGWVFYTASSGKGQSLIKLPATERYFDADRRAYVRIVCEEIALCATGNGEYWPVVAEIIAKIEVSNE